MRPTYETASDRQREQSAAERFAAHFGGELINFPPMARVDKLLMIGGKMRALMEVKCRTHKFGHYDTYMLSAEKYMTLLRASRDFNIAGLVVVGFTDCIAWVDTKAVGGLRIIAGGGRTDRNDPQDIEKVVKIPMVKFTKLEAK
jgi:hypothetical protein